MRGTTRTNVAIGLAEELAQDRGLIAARKSVEETPTVERAPETTVPLSQIRAVHRPNFASEGRM